MDAFDEILNTVTVADLQARLDEHLHDMARGPIVIVDKGRPVAALIHLSDPVDVQRVETRPKWTLQDLLEERAKQIRRSGGISEEEFWAAVEKHYGLGESERKPSMDEPQYHENANGPQDFE